MEIPLPENSRHGESVDRPSNKTLLLGIVVSRQYPRITPSGNMQKYQRERPILNVNYFAR